METLYCVKLLGNGGILGVEHLFAESKQDALVKGERLLEQLVKQGLWEYREVEVVRVMPLEGEL